MPVIGFLSALSPGPAAPFAAGVRRGLSETGYVEGQNVTIEYRWAEDHYDRLPALAIDLVGRKVDVILASGGDASAFVAKGATSTIPIVFAVGGDPVERGLVASLARPGGNLTGISVLATELNPKRLELLSELVPEAGVVPRPDGGGAGGRAIISVAGSIPPEQWNRLGTRLLPKMRAAGTVTATILLEIKLDESKAPALSTELSQIVEENGLSATVHVAQRAGD
jgi:hypothetical protein